MATEHWDSASQGGDKEKGIAGQLLSLLALAGAGLQTGRTCASGGRKQQIGDHRETLSLLPVHTSSKP